MRNLFIYGLLAVALISSCSKKQEIIAPKTVDVHEPVVPTIMINNSKFGKTMDIYSTSVDNTTATASFTSSFLVNNNNTSGSLTFAVTSITKNLEVGNYTLDAEGTTSSVVYTSQNQGWSTLKGHQKGSQFKVLATHRLEAGSGYVSEMTVQVSCFLYNDKGEFMPFTCITSVKF